MAAAVVLTQSVSLSHLTDFGYQARGVITFSPSPATYTTGGIVCNLNVNPLVKAARAPLFVSVSGRSGYIYAYVPGSNAQTGLLRIFAQTSGAAAGDPLGQLTDGSAIPAAVTADSIHWHGIWRGME